MPSVSGSVVWGTDVDPASTVTIPAGTTAYSWTLNAPSAGRWIYLENFLDSAGHNLTSSGCIGSCDGETTATLTHSGTPLAGASFISLRVWQGLGNTTTGTFTGSITFTVGPVTYCAYGTERNPSAAVYTTLVGAVIDAIAFALGLGPLGIVALDTLIGAPIIFPSCEHQPPVAPTFTPDDFILGTSIPSPSGALKLPQLLATGLWFFYCQCTAAPTGSPDPVPFPPPDYTGQPVGPADQPIPTCNPEDLCTELNKIANQLNALSLQVIWARQDITLIQRQAVPFAYVPGTLHSGLSGQGTFHVADILGLAVQITTDPAYLSRDSDTPESTYRWGTISWGTADGWQVRHWITHNPHLLMGIGGESTLVGFTFADGVVANIQELVREF